MSSPRITFRRITDDDLPLLHEWLHRPHVAQWWDGSPSLEEVEEEFALALAGSPAFRCFLAYAEGVPIGFIQCYTAVAFHDEGWWTDEHDPGVRGIDQFLANADELGRGIGTELVRAFVKRLFSEPGVTRIQTDPRPDNPRAIRCYEKAGFRAVREVDTPDGRALLMYCDRPAR